MSDGLANKELARLSTLRMQMLQVHPFWGHLLLQVKLVPAPELDAMAATDCVRHIWFNPARTKRLSLQQLGFVLAHEAFHQLMASLSRQRGRNPNLWNCATDHAINHMVAEMKNPARPNQPMYRPPPRILLGGRFADKIAEAIYEYIAREEVPPARGLTLVLGPGGGEGRQIRVPNVTDHGGDIDVHLPGRPLAGPGAGARPPHGRGPGCLGRKPEARAPACRPAAACPPARAGAGAVATAAAAVGQPAPGQG